MNQLETLKERIDNLPFNNSGRLYPSDLIVEVLSLWNKEWAIKSHIAREIGVSRRTIYSWDMKKKNFIKRGGDPNSAIYIGDRGIICCTSSKSVDGQSSKLKR